MAKTMGKKLATMEADKLANKVNRLLFEHSNGSISSGQKAFEIAEGLSQRIAGRSFNALLAAWTAHGYRPTLRNDTDPYAGILADLYDYTQARRGVNVVAFRGVLS